MIISIFERRAIVAGLVLAAIIVALFSNILFTGRILSASDLIFTSPFFAQAAPTGYTHPANAYLSDQVYQLIPWRYLAWNALRQGRIPLWDPYTLAGRPFLATQQSAFFYPINLALTILPFEQTFIWSAMIRLWIAGFTMYLLVRYYGLGQIAALISAISFMLSGFMIVWLGHPHTNVAIWLPTLILCADTLITNPRRSTTLRAIAALALIIGVQFSGGHAQTSLDILIAFGLYYVLRSTFFTLRGDSSTITKIKSLLLFPALVLSLGACVAAIHLLPFIEWLPNSEILGARSAGKFIFLRTDVWKHLASLALLLFPNLYNNPIWEHFQYFSPITSANYNEEAIYIGFIPLIFACIAVIIYLKKLEIVKIWFIITVISLGRALHLPVFDWINQLPMFRLAVPERIRLVVIFALCILAGFGAQALVDSTNDADRQIERLWVRLLAGVIALGLVLAIVTNLLLPVYGLKVSDYFKSPMLYVSNLLACAVLPAFYYFKQKRSARRLAFQIALLSITSIDLIIFGYGYNPSVPADKFYPSTPITSYIQGDTQIFRFTAPHADMVPDTNTLFSIPDIRGIDFRTVWYTHYIDIVPGKGGGLYNTGFTLLDSPLIRALNIKYIAAARYDDFKNDQTLRLVEKYKDIALWEVAHPQPRAFMIYNLVLASDDKEAAARLKRTPGMIFDHVILLQADHPILLDRSTIVSRNHVLSIDYQPEQTTWQVSTDRAGYLFLSDAYYPGWKVYIDNQISPLYRANLAFRAVYVPAGEHVVTFRYEPWYLLPGSAISLLTLALLVALLICSYVLRDSKRVVVGPPCEIDSATN